MPELKSADLGLGVELGELSEFSFGKKTLDVLNHPRPFAAVRRCRRGTFALGNTSRPATHTSVANRTIYVPICDANYVSHGVLARDNSVASPSDSVSYP